MPSAKATLPAIVLEYHCQACLPDATGCNDGYYGNGNVVGGSCTSCPGTSYRAGFTSTTTTQCCEQLCRACLLAATLPHFSSPHFCWGSAATIDSVLRLAVIRELQGRCGQQQLHQDRGRVLQPSNHTTQPAGRALLHALPQCNSTKAQEADLAHEAAASCTCMCRM